ncbi:DNA/RNA polymerase [Didymella exigua CBS 183.55]|uniref:DNA/RNA polymerase n=1 Tax=Didymella exigua CBS 183.55 TaxID=1150837 RepID=A0A6A5RB51_9PLEO|nr:DNA/RNA polymerase [Didymella exigua CBS 183.55]KAF1925465.1 DNA/RNA polymerase [Didymella exigua CBS 183.55]
MDRPRRRRLKRQLDSTIIHFDYDCFYASVFEREQPHLKALPLAVQQKQIVVTCNYEARRRGLYKLQLITEAKKACPDVVIVLGEDLTRFRNASKQLYAFLSSFSWNSRCERLGFDEVWLDVSDLVDSNVATLTLANLSHSFFRLSKHDPTVGFSFDANHYAGPVYPETTHETHTATSDDSLRFRLLLASHLAQHIRQKLEYDLGYTATVGISTNKLLSKLVGNVHKPNSQTTLIPPYNADDNDWDNVTPFIDDHEVGKIPGIGFKIAQKIRHHVLQRPADFDDGLVYGGTKDPVCVRDVRTYSDMGPDVLERILGGPGMPHGIGTRVWNLLNGSDDTPVSQARELPRQISIEDSYVRLDTMSEVMKQLRVLAISLLRRMRTDLVELDQEPVDDTGPTSGPPTQRWLAHPKTLRLSTRPRPPQNPDGSRNRSFARISKSAPMPSFVFNLKEGVETLADRLIREALIPLFKQLHPEKQVWNLSLVNLAATNMVEGASEKGGAGRDIGKMFRRQDDVLAPFKVRDEPTGGLQENPKPIAERQVVSEEPGEEPPIRGETHFYPPKFALSRFGSEDIPTPSQETATDIDDFWEEDDEMLDADTYRCDDCGAYMPLFAMGAHERWHAQG